MFRYDMRDLYRLLVVKQSKIMYSMPDSSCEYVHFT